MTEKTISTIRLLPDGFYVSGEFHPVAPGADFLQRLEEALLDADIASTFAETEEPVQCIFATSRFSLSPLQEPVDRAESMFCLMNTTAPSEETILHDEVEELGIRITFAVPTRTVNFLRRTLSDPEIHAESSEIIQFSPMESGMMVKAEKNALTLIAYRNSKPIHCSRVETQGENNQCYFILSLWQQMQFDPLEDQLHLESDSDILRKGLNTYIKCVS